jgi:hypothetical protein
VKRACIDSACYGIHSGLLKECGALRRELLKAKAVTSDNDTELVACRRRQAMAEKRAEELNAELTDLKLLLLQLNAKETKNTDIVKVIRRADLKPLSGKKRRCVI